MANGSKRRHGSGWEIRIYVGKKNGHSVYARKQIPAMSAKDADVETARFLIEHHDNPFDPTTITVAQLEKQWWPVWIAEGKSGNTVAGWQSILRRYIRPQVGTVKLRKITVSRIDRLYSDLRAAGITPANLEKVHTILSVMLRYAASRELIKHNPILNVRTPRSKRKDLSIPTPEVVARLLKAAQEHHPSVLVFWIMYSTTGARRGEIGALQWSHVDFESSSLRIEQGIRRQPYLSIAPTKTENVRTIALDAATLNMLEQWRIHCESEAILAEVPWCDDALLFSGTPSGDVPIDPDDWTEKFKETREKLELPEQLKLKNFRHFTATTMLANGAPSWLVAGKLGHTERMTTEQYAEWIPAADREFTDAHGAQVWKQVNKLDQDSQS